MTNFTAHIKGDPNMPEETRSALIEVLEAAAKQLAGECMCFTAPQDRPVIATGSHGHFHFKIHKCPDCQKIVAHITDSHGQHLSWQRCTEAGDTVSLRIAGETVTTRVDADH